MTAGEATRAPARLALIRSGDCQEVLKALDPAASEQFKKRSRYLCRRAQEWYLREGSVSG